MTEMMPPIGDQPGVADTDLRGFLSQVRREISPLVWYTLVAGALCWVLLPVLTVYLPVPSFLLPATLRNRHAERVFSRAPYLPRQAMFLLKMYACMCWGQHDQVRARLALPPYPADPGTFRR
jgi:hypothetical protein